MKSVEKNMFTTQRARFVNNTPKQETKRPHIKGRQQLVLTAAAQINTNNNSNSAYKRIRTIKCRQKLQLLHRLIPSLNCGAGSGRCALFYATLLVLFCVSFIDLVVARATDSVAAAATAAESVITTTALRANHNYNHKQHHRNAMLYARNNFTDLSNLSAMDLIEGKGGADVEDIMTDTAVALPARTPDAKTNAGCPPTTSSHCLRCNSEGCIKCPAYLMTDTRQCVEQCPSGYIDQWSAHTEFMGRVCVSTGYSGPVMAAIAGLIGGFVVCLTLLAVAMMLVRRRRRRKTIKQKLINENTMDRSDFLRQLNEMRPNAEYFLAMLNDTRRQIRKLYLSGEVSAANSYRPIVRDLAKILILLNRPIELIPAAPHDWNRLYAWSEQALERYKPQVGHLIDFFQPSGVGGGRGGSSGGGITDDFDATFFPQKSNLYRQSMLPGTGQQKLHMFGSLISLHEFEEPRPSDPFGSSFNTLKNGNLISDLNASSLWLEDEFYKLGFRPQDEITTEL
uniref:Uncharacterized protein n=1 Tax=Ceratitis capitata TaxID=7213 RepID=W8C602_CERCA